MPLDEWRDYMIREYNALADRYQDALAAAQHAADEAYEMDGAA